MGPGSSLAGIPCIVPTALGLSGGELPEPLALVIYAGMARFGIALSNPRGLDCLQQAPQQVSVTSERIVHIAVCADPLLHGRLSKYLAVLRCVPPQGVGRGICLWPR